MPCATRGVSDGHAADNQTKTARRAAAEGVGRTRQSRPESNSLHAFIGAGWRATLVVTETRARSDDAGAAFEYKLVTRRRK
jgi:hypothetical protein